jgi:hypothetical protein
VRHDLSTHSVYVKNLILFAPLIPFQLILSFLCSHIIELPSLHFIIPNNLIRLDDAGFTGHLLNGMNCIISVRSGYSATTETTPDNPCVAEQRSNKFLPRHDWSTPVHRALPPASVCAKDWYCKCLSPGSYPYFHWCRSKQQIPRRVFHID